MILVFLTGPAAAATFDFTAGALRSDASPGMTSGGIGLTMHGGDGSGLDFDLALGGGRGLGIVGTKDTDVWASQIEGWGASPEVLSLTFDREVRIEAITFTWTDYDDRVGLSGAGGARVFKPGPSGRLLLGSDLWTGSAFTITPQTWTFCTWFSGQEICEERYSGFRVASIEVSDATPIVPLPASMLLLSGALAGFGCLAWRRKKDG